MSTYDPNNPSGGYVSGNVFAEQPRDLVPITFDLGKGTIRNIRPSDDYLIKMSNVAKSVSPNVGLVIVSGGQPSRSSVIRKSGGRSATRFNGLQLRTGSTRHDVGIHGDANTSDLALTVNGKRVSPSQRPDLYTKFIESSAQAGFSGIGHYPWGIHVGGGTPAFWGPDRTSATANSTFREAYERGRGAMGNPLIAASAISPSDRDILVRTVYGEAAGEGSDGQAAVAHVILNRINDSRWGNDVRSVAKAGNASGYHQFSTWNPANRGGNNLAVTLSSDSEAYKTTAEVVDNVLQGRIPDNTNGSVYYYSPAGMPNGAPPSWWNNAVAEKGTFQQIGGHRFAGRTNGQGERIIRQPPAEKRIVTERVAIPESQWTDQQFAEVRNSGVAPTKLVQKEVTVLAATDNTYSRDDTPTGNQPQRRATQQTQRAEQQDEAFNTFRQYSRTRSLQALQTSQQTTAQALQKRGNNFFSPFAQQETPGEVQVI